MIILATVAAYSWYVSGQIAGLRRLQTELTDRNRRKSLQLLRIQNDLNQLGLAMRDMLDTETQYPLTAWSAQFERIRRDLNDAFARQADAAAAPASDERTYLVNAVQQFWDASDRLFALAGSGQESVARSQVQVSLQARQAAISATVARLLVQNNAREEDAGRQTQAIYDRVERQAYWFLAATLIGHDYVGWSGGVQPYPFSLHTQNLHLQGRPPRDGKGAEHVVPDHRPQSGDVHDEHLRRGRARLREGHAPRVSRRSKSVRTSSACFSRRLR